MSGRGKCRRRAIGKDPALVILHVATRRARIGTNATACPLACELPLRRLVMIRPLPLLLLLTGCSPFLDGHRSRDEILKEAARQERDRCSGLVEGEADRRLVAPGTILSVEGRFVARRNTKGPDDFVLRGANLHIGPFVGLGREALEQTLVCHQVRRVLGRLGSPQALPDPYWLPGEWLDISVALEGDGFLIALTGESVDVGDRILANARASVPRRW
jgi:hypothetical protein